MGGVQEADAAAGGTASADQTLTHSPHPSPHARALSLATTPPPHLTLHPSSIIVLQLGQHALHHTQQAQQHLGAPPPRVVPASPARRAWGVVGGRASRASGRGVVGVCAHAAVQSRASSPPHCTPQSQSSTTTAQRTPRTLHSPFTHLGGAAAAGGGQRS